jgi:hypothetical protein
MGDPIDKKPKPAAKVGPKTVIVTTATPLDGHDPEFDRLFWSNFTQAPIEKIGPPPPNATLNSPYNHGPVPALTPAQLFDFLIHQMGFDNSSPGAPATDPNNKGAGVGPAKAQGYKVYAAIQIVDPKGNQVYVGYGAYTGGGGPHGEEQAINNLKANLPKGIDLKGGRLITAVTQCPCGADRHNCASQIESFAKQHGLTAETYVPERDAVNPNAKRPVSPSTAARGSMRTDRPVVRLRNVAPVAPATTGASPPAANGNRAVVGTPDLSGIDYVGTPGMSDKRATQILVAFHAVNFIANTVSDHIQSRRLKEALDVAARSTRRHLAENPDEGALLIVFMSQQIPFPYSIIEPGARFEFIETEFGKTMEDAKARWAGTKSIRKGFESGIRVITRFVWIPPQNEW